MLLDLNVELEHVHRTSCTGAHPELFAGRGWGGGGQPFMQLCNLISPKFWRLSLHYQGQSLSRLKTLFNIVEERLKIFGEL